MQRHAYYIGVDGGGTCSKAVLMDEKYKILKKAKGDCLNYYSINYRTAKLHFQSLMDRVTDTFDKKDVLGIVIGMSALDHEEDQEKANNFAKDIFPNADVYMNSDLYAAIMGHTLGKPGVMVVAGTGTMIMAIDRNGKEHIAGGYGYLLGDHGSAYTIAVEAIEKALLAYEGVEEKTILQKEMMKHFSIIDYRDLIKVIYGSRNPRKKISSFAPCVSVAAESGDQCALKILKANAQRLADMTVSLIRRTGLTDLDSVGIYGGVLINDQIVRTHFSEIIQSNFPGINIIEPVNTPEIGAAIVAVSRGSHIHGIS